jgi:hypothetical protein
MRAIGTSKVLSWRWSPCLALALGACGFAAFALLAIPEQIGNVSLPTPGDAALRFGGGLASTRTSADGPSSLEDSGSLGTSNTFSAVPSNPGSPHAANVFPKRGFTPPLERPDPPPPAAPPQPVLEVQPQPVAAPVPPPADAPPPQAEPQTASASIEQGVRNAD